MSENKYTNGNWFSSDSTVMVCFQNGTHSDTWHVAECWSPEARVNRTNGTEEAKANAKLISAAPDLLQSLQELLKDYEETDFDTAGKSETLIQKAKAAIEKATQ